MNSIRGHLPRLLGHYRQVDYYRLRWDAIAPNRHPLIMRTHIHNFRICI